jgi:hypothetical protein
VTAQSNAGRRKTPRWGWLVWRGRRETGSLNFFYNQRFSNMKGSAKYTLFTDVHNPSNRTTACYCLLIGLLKVLHFQRSGSAGLGKWKVLPAIHRHRICTTFRAVVNVSSSRFSCCESFMHMGIYLARVSLQPGTSSLTCYVT